MRYTIKQYEAAIESLREAMQQLEPDGRNCTCCGDSGHQAFECGFNPLVAMETCKKVATDARQFHEEMHGGAKFNARAVLHNLVHYLGGWDTHMGETIGPARIRFPGPNGWKTLADFAASPVPAGDDAGAGGAKGGGE